MNEYHQLMSELFAATQDFNKKFNKWLKTQKKPNSREKEPGEVSIARDIFWEKFSNLHLLKLSPLEVKLKNSAESFNEVIEFLSVDVPCHRCGYQKECFLTKLKSAFLTNNQKVKLSRIVLEMCRKPRYRREFGDWARLMIKIADFNFIENLSDLIQNPDNNVYQTAKWLQNRILENRKDLQSAID